ncbi:ASC domain containing protein [Asbolus verrucosus]|uniref:ASC domain containing protein n=1 Tax=Asbolus verrucosus TaxID=1661398 RepID=A0A482VAY9_ASBVE|nr:ASC domain containing protein [Asbolus verrucosus]
MRFNVSHFYKKDKKLVSEPTPSKKRSFIENTKKYFKEYSEVTGIHGLRYLTETRSIFENPVVISFSTKDTPIYEIPFPAVTICPESKYKIEKFNYTDIYYKLINENETISDENLRNFEYMSLLCKGENGKTILKNSFKTVGDDFFEVIDKLKPDLFVVCSFMGFWQNCTELFTPIVIDEGVCYSFNMLGRSEIFREDVIYDKNFYNVTSPSDNYCYDAGYADNAGIYTYPRRALVSGADNSLDITLFHNPNDTDYICSQFLEGFRVMIHSPLDMPRLSKHYFRVPLDRAVVVAIQPNLIATSDSIKKYSSETRNCYTSTERRLKYFKVYSQSNCMLECQTNYTLNMCGCVNFFMPRDNATAICGGANTACLKNADAALKINDLTSKISGGVESYKSSCDCKPSCTELTYSLETSQSNLQWKEFFASVKEVNIENKNEDLSSSEKSKEMNCMDRLIWYQILEDFWDYLLDFL